MRFSISTKGFNDVIDITDRISEIVAKSKVKDGVCLISCPGSTAGLTTIEYDPNLLEDFKEFLEKIAPSNRPYHHDETWPARLASQREAGGGDKNAFSHIRSALIKPFLAVPIENGKLILGTWQQIVLIDFDNRPREREIFIKIIKSEQFAC
jgi:secondary thiamine-phosphate synthase enzyme